MTVEVSRNELISFDCDGEFCHAGWNGSAARASKPTGKGTFMWSLCDRKGNLIRTTRSEQAAIDHCMGY